MARPHASPLTPHGEIYRQRPPFLQDLKGSRRFFLRMPVSQSMLGGTGSFRHGSTEFDTVRRLPRSSQSGVQSESLAAEQELPRSRTVADDAFRLRFISVGRMGSIMFRFPGLVAIALLVACVMGCSDRGASLPPAPPAVVTVSQPLEKEVTDQASFTGRTAAVESVDVRARVSG